MFWITLGPQHPHSNLTETAAAYFFFEYLYVLINLGFYQNELWSQSVNRYRTLTMFSQ